MNRPTAKQALIAATTAPASAASNDATVTLAAPGHASDLHAALEHIEQGIALVDAQLRVVAWNRRFRDLLDFPDQLFGPDTMFHDLVRFNARRGEYGDGDVETLVAERNGSVRLVRTHHVQRTRPDGTVLEISGSPLPDGGFVTTYTDVTERRASERALRETEARSRVVIEAAHDAVIALDERGTITGWNRRATELFGWAPNEAIGRKLGWLVLPAHARRTFRRVLRLCAKGDGPSGQRLELSANSKDGTTFIVELSIAAATFEGARIFSAFLRDITDRKLAEEKLRASEERFRTIIDSEPECVKMIARDGTLLEMNPAGLRMIGANSLEQVRGACVYYLIAPEHRAAFEAMNARVFAGEEVTLKFDILGLQGKRLSMETTAAPLRDARGQVTAHLAITRDVTEANRLVEQVRYQATHDMLTALPNRNQFEERLAGVIESSRRNGSHHVLCFFDLDQFKVVNDTCGHVAGDELLKQLAEVLRSGVRSRDLLARIGGDEFALLMEDCTVDNGLAIVEKMRRRIEDFRFLWSAASFSVSASIGVVPIEPDCEGATQIMSAVDAACYAAKDAGRNRVHVYDSADSDLSRRHGEMQWVTRLQDALDADRFELHVQPIVPIGTGGSQGAHHEILLRMVNPDGALNLPGAFLPAAERYGLSGRVDRWVVDRVLTVLDSMDADAGSFNINLSAQSLGDEALLGFIDARLQGRLELAGRLCFEITETAAITDLQTALRFIAKLRALGCRTALDDFGSGLSSFAYLRNIPVDYLKIDGMFVRDIETDLIDRAMVRSIHEVGLLMGKKTVAEFVENDAILSILREIGVDYAQGHGVGRPQPFRLG